MSAIYQDEGLTYLLQQRNGTTGGASPNAIRLYTAVSGTLSKSTVIGNFTEVTLVMGYLTKTVGGGNWSYSLDAVNHWVTGTGSFVWVFTAGSGLTILGYYVTGGSPSKSMLAEQFASPVVIPPGGGTLSLTVNDQYQGC